MNGSVSVEKIANGETTVVFFQQFYTLRMYTVYFSITLDPSKYHLLRIEFDPCRNVYGTKRRISVKNVELRSGEEESRCYDARKSEARE